MFFVSVADKELSVSVSGLESTLADWFVSVDNKRVKRSENSRALPDSAGEEGPEREDRMDLSADQRLAGVPAARQTGRAGLRGWVGTCRWSLRMV